MDSVTKGLIQAYHEVQENMTKGYVVTKADKKGNTPAWQGYKAGKKKKDGSPLYTAADHLKNEEVETESETVDESIGSAIDKTLDAAGEVAGTALKAPAKAVGYVTGLPKGVKNAFKKGKKRAEASESYEADEILCNLVESGKFSVEEIAKITGIELEEAQTAYEKARKAAARRAADRNAARRRGEMGGNMERETYTNEAGKRMHYKGYSARDGE
tara:strand:- start:328 stop:972 length:645 start_codon:yes stop_codon:yes gene_type:complete